MTKQLTGGATQRVRIILDPHNYLSQISRDIEDFAGPLRAAHPDWTIEYAVPTPQGLGVTLWEVLSVWVNVMPGVIAGAVADELVRLLRARFKKTPNRPKLLNIYGARGEVIKSVELRTPKSRGKDVTEENRGYTATRKKPRTRKTPIWPDDHHEDKSG
jgi:hypothetical protein